MGRVIAIEGVHGIGKSSVCKELERRDGNIIIEEDFMDEREHMSPLARNFHWISDWLQDTDMMQRINRDKTIYTDRSPYSSLVYESGKLKTMITDLVGELNVTVVILQPANTNFVYKRILERLLQEPNRTKYREHERQWLETVNARYQKLPATITGAWSVKVVVVEEYHTPADIADMVETAIK